MVSATDIITYIGVPLAVLGVAPIFYTFVSALYARLKFSRVLRKNGIAPRIRARMMTGVVEVDLPVLQLYTLNPERPQYWLPSASPKTIDGASWSAYNFDSREGNVVTCRLQRSDKITLPEARVDFKSLLEFLQDLDCYPDLDGFKEFRTRSQNAVGASLMCIRDSQLHGRSSRTVLNVAKPGDRDSLISLKLANLWSFRKSPYKRTLNRTVPPFGMIGPLLESQHATTSLETNKVASIPLTSGETVESSSTNAFRQKRRYFVIRMRESRMHVSVHESPVSSGGFELLSDHLQLLDSDPSSEDSPTQRDSWRDWFACAAVAVYGFQERRSFYRFLPNQRDLHKAQAYDIKAEDAMYYGLTDIGGKPCDERLEFINNSDLDMMNTADGTRDPWPVQSADGHHRIWVVKEDLDILEEAEKRLENCNRVSHVERALKRIDRSHVFEKRIAMPNLLRLCLRWLISNPIHFESLVIGSLPNEPWDLNKLAQHTSDLIVRMIILDFDFAKKVKSQIDSSMNAQAHPLDKKTQHDLFEWSRKLVEGSSLEVSGHFCCAMVLLAIIGQRAEYLLSGKDVKHCEDKLGDVYLS